MHAVCICPVCHAPLALNAEGAQCPVGHHFDRARQGYINLLVGRAAGQHGDNAEMIRARRDFLDSGYYAPLKDALCTAAQQYMPQEGVLLDAGCGEGYYTDAVMNTLSEKRILGYGLDISREALRAAGKRQSAKCGALQLFAAGVYEMPIADDAIDMILNLFAPLADAEYRRVGKIGSTLLMAIPAARHLWELKEVLYSTPRENQIQDFSLNGYLLLEKQDVSASFTLPDAASIDALFSMTPYRYRSPADGRARLATCQTLSVTASFHLLVYKRVGT